MVAWIAVMERVVIIKFNETVMCEGTAVWLNVVRNFVMNSATTLNVGSVHLIVDHINVNVLGLVVSMFCKF